MEQNCQGKWDGKKVKDQEKMIQEFKSVYKYKEEKKMLDWDKNKIKV